MVWTLLIVYQLKHFIADYPLQGAYMLGKFKKYPDFILPLLAHAGVHCAFTFLIVLACGKGLSLALGLGLLDMGIHFLVDRIKASPDLLGRFKALSANEMRSEIIPTLLEQKDNGPAAPGTPRHERHETALRRLRSNTFFWWALGWDQMTHHLTHYLIIWSILC